jgi:hypothetical protein
VQGGIEWYGKFPTGHLRWVLHELICMILIGFNGSIYIFRTIYNAEENRWEEACMIPQRNF